MMHIERSDSSSSRSSIRTNIGFEEGWNQIQDEAVIRLETYLLNRAHSNEAIKSLFTAQEYSKIYTLIYNMCTQSPRNWSKELFVKYSETLENFLKKKTLKRLIGVSGPQLIMDFRFVWNNYLIYIHWMERFFGYLNKYYVKISGEGSLMSKGMIIFYDSIYSEIKNELSASFSESIEQDRVGNKCIKDEYLKEVVDICLELSKKSNIPDIYENEIEGILLNNLHVHYNSFVSNWINNDTLLEYLERVDKILKCEEDRCNRILLNSTWIKFRKSLIQILLANEMKLILSNSDSIKKMFWENKYDQLSLLYKLFSSVNNGVQTVSVHLKNYLLECGQLIIEKFSKFINQTDSIELETMIDKCIQQNSSHWPWTCGKLLEIPFKKKTQELLFIEVMFTLHDHSNFLLNECFERDLLIQKIIKESFETIVNMDLGLHNQTQLICNYCDYLLKKDCWKCDEFPNLLQDDFFESTSNKLVELFSFTHCQDYFLEVYRYNLAKRLLQYHTELEKNELLIITLLKNKCGASFTLKLEGMIADMKMTQGINEKYREYLNNIRDTEIENKEYDLYDDLFTETGELVRKPFSSNLDFSVSVLTSSNWPSLMSSKIDLPMPFKQFIDKFELFYASETAHRKLSWIHWYGQCILDLKIKNRFGKKSYEIHCNTYQACILLLFNENVSLSFEQIQNTLLMDSSILMKHIDSLCSEIDILVRTRNNGCIQEQIFEVNEKFNSDTNNLTIKLPSQGEMAVKNRMEEDKSHAVEAAIVRVMKIKQEMTQEELISYVTSLPNFKFASKSVISKIEYLIEREYIGVHEDDPNRYVYLV